jgi:hypothetical protein
MNPETCIRFTPYADDTCCCFAQLEASLKGDDDKGPVETAAETRSGLGPLEILTAPLEPVHMTDSNRLVAQGQQLSHPHTLSDHFTRQVYKLSDSPTIPTFGPGSLPQ